MLFTDELQKNGTQIEAANPLKPRLRMKDHSKTKFGGSKTKKNSTSKKLKAAVAVILVMASLFAMTVFVHAVVVERILGDVTDEINLTSSRSQYMNHYEVTESW